MTLNWLERFSDWNPQIFRELKGRLKRRNLILTITATLTAQLLVLMYFWNLIPPPRSTDKPYLYPSHSAYCTGKGSYGYFECLYDALGHPLLDWQHWWFDIFQALSWTLPFVLLIAGVYMLISDLGKEERRGTLNFIRLSPQTSHNILLGKVLGVPAIPYLAAALTVPLHLLAAIGAQVSIAEVFSIYLVTAAVCTFFYSSALLYAFLGGVQGWIGAVVIWFGYSIFFQLWQTYSSFNHSSEQRYLGLGEWFHLWIGTNLGFAVAFALLTLGTGSYWIWQAVNRRFRNPNVTLLNKRQSYQMTLCFEVWLIGFFVRDIPEYYRPFNELIVLGFCNLLWFIVLIATITPQRQMLLDWARYRRERVTRTQPFWRRSMMPDLLWGEKSPALVAIALNLLIAMVVVTPWILGWGEAGDSISGLATIALGSTFILICAVIAQLMMFMKSPRRVAWAVGLLAIVIILPPVVLCILQLYPDKAPLAWLFSIGAFAALQSGLSTTAVLTAFLGHLGILSLLSLRLTQQLRRAGESELKALMAAGRG